MPNKRKLLEIYNNNLRKHWKHSTEARRRTRITIIVKHSTESPSQGNKISKKKMRNELML